MLTGTAAQKPRIEIGGRSAVRDSAPCFMMPANGGNGGYRTEVIAAQTQGTVVTHDKLIRCIVVDIGSWAELDTESTARAGGIIDSQ